MSFGVCRRVAAPNPPNRATPKLGFISLLGLEHGVHRIYNKFDVFDCIDMFDRFFDRIPESYSDFFLSEVYRPIDSPTKAKWGLRLTNYKCKFHEASSQTMVLLTVVNRFPNGPEVLIFTPAFTPESVSMHDSWLMLKVMYPINSTASYDLFFISADTQLGN